MFRFISIAGPLFLSLFAGAQSVLRTVVPSKAVVAGESFQVQYIQESGNQAFTVNTPEFRDFKKVAGPYSYTGTGQNGRTVFNTVYTLVALKPGRFIIPGASIQTTGKAERSNDTVLEVISPAEAAKRASTQAGNAPTAYYLAPGEDPEQKMKENLFVRVTADKRSCYPGEPVVAEFKLYSRLESRSDITRNPGFYGFTVYDMVSLADQQQTTETINGKLFSVHTIRKVQLYPQHEGRFSIDEMQIKHTVEFSTVSSSKPTEQQIAEGVLQQNNFDETPQTGKVSYEYVSETQVLSIDVKPLPAGKPQGFSGATGTFSARAYLVNDSLSLHEEGMLKLVISGRGNFTQLGIPVVTWPEGIEGFEPVIMDSLEKNSVPLSGTRVFSFPFIAGKPGQSILPAFTFSSFDPVKRNYSVIRTEAQTIRVSATEKKVSSSAPVAGQKQNTADLRLLFYALTGLIIAGFGIWIILRKRNKKKAGIPVQAPVINEPEDPLRPARDQLSASPVVFCTALQQSLWNACASLLHLAGSSLNKQVLKRSLQENQVPENTVQGLLRTLETCEAVVYAGTPMSGSKEEMLGNAAELLAALRRSLL